MKLALLGTGMIVTEVLPVLTTIEGIELEAILSTPRSLDKAEALAKQYGLSQATSDYELILSNPEVDTIYVGTPNHTHYDYAKKALLAGKHVICEKPFTLHLEEFEELAKLAQEKELLLMEAITNQYLANFTAIKEAVSDIGDIKIVNINYSQYSSRYDAFKRGEIAPAFNPEMGGGALRDLNIYNIHLLVGLFGKPHRVEYLPNVERGVDTSGILVLDYGNFKAVAIGAKDCSAEIRSTIQGDKGAITIFGATNTLPEIGVTLNGQKERTVNLNSPQHRMYDEFVAFEKMVATKDFDSVAKQLEHSRQVMEVLDQASKAL